MPKHVFVCSPYRGNVVENVLLARDIEDLAITARHAPIAPHLLLPGVLNDADPAEREDGLRIGRLILRGCSEMWVWDECSPSDGMVGELKEATRVGLPIMRVGRHKGRLYLKGAWNE